MDLTQFSVNRRVSVRDLFAAFESTDIARLQQLAHSVQTFNRRASLRSTTTRDRSAPRLDHHLEHLLAIQHYNPALLKHVVPRVTYDVVVIAQPSVRAKEKTRQKLKRSVCCIYTEKETFCPETCP